MSAVAGSSSDPQGSRGFLWFAAVTAVALGVRLIFLAQARACPLFEYLVVDARAYDAWAQRIAAGDWMGDQVFYQAPLYPYFLALIKLVLGPSAMAIRIVQVVLGSITCGVLFLAGRRLAGHAAGVVAGLGLALYPPAIFFDLIVQKAGVGSLLVACLLLALASYRSSPSKWKCAAAGVLLGLLALTREETLVLAPVLIGWLWWRGRGEARSPRPVRAVFFVLFVAGLALPLCIVAARNHRVGGEWLLSTSQAGTNFFIGNNAEADGVYAPLRPGRSDTSHERQDAVELAELAAGRKLSPSEVSDHWSERAFEFIRAQPFAWLQLMARKAALLVNAYEIPDAENQYFYEEYSSLLRVLSRIWHFGILVPLAILALFLGFKHRRDQSLLIVFVATLCVSVLAFYVFGRYRFTLVPPLMLLAGAGAVDSFKLIRQREWRSLRLPTAACALAALAANWPIYARDHHLPEAYSNAGAAASAAGNHAQSIALLRKSLAMNPNQPDTLYNLALSVGRTGGMSEAIALLREALRMRPDDPRIEMMLGTALAETGKFEEAVEHLANAVKLGPQDIDSRANYRMLLEQTGRWKEAIEQSKALANLRPSDPDALGELARMLATCPDDLMRDGAAAVKAGEEAVRIDGRRDARLLGILATAYEAAGRKDDAIKTVGEALTKAEAARDVELAKLIGAHLRRLTGP